MKTLDWNTTKARAKRMSEAELFGAINDCVDAAECAEDLELAGCRVDKSGGYYRDEASVYRAELKLRLDFDVTAMSDEQLVETREQLEGTRRGREAAAEVESRISSGRWSLDG